jgi:hypothetical protein
MYWSCLIVKNKKTIMLSGLPRSGTTWTAEVLGQAPDTFYLYEPDNEKFYFKTILLKDEVNQFPYLKKGSESPLYYKLWKDIFNRHSYEDVFPDKNNMRAYYLEKMIGQKVGEVHETFFNYSDESKKDVIQKRNVDHPKIPMDQRLLIKSVDNIFALDWLDYHFDFIPLIIIRHPANTISSYMKLHFQDSWRNIFSQEDLVKDYFKDILPKLNRKTEIIDKMAIQLSAAYYVVNEQLQNHPNWMIIRHEDLCEDPVKQFKKLYKTLDLKWTSNVKQFIKDSNAPGKGYKTNRIAKEEINKYKTLLSKEQIQKIREIYDIFGNPFDYDI